MAYEVFKRTAKRVASPALSIVPDGRITLNSAAARILSEARVKNAALLWDAANLRIAIKATTKNDPNSYAVTIIADQHSGSIRAKAFISHIGWIAAQRQMFPATWDDRERILEASLPSQFLDPNNVRTPEQPPAIRGQGLADRTRRGRT